MSEGGQDGRGGEDDKEDRGGGAVLLATAPPPPGAETRSVGAGRRIRRVPGRPVLPDPTPSDLTPGRLAASAPRRLAALAALGLVLVALAVRVIAAIRLTPQADEPASVLAARMVAEKGVPVLPSGTLYLHGATLSYLLAPFAWLGRADLADLETLRLVNAVVGAAAVGLTYALGRRVGGSAPVGLVAAAGLALDPLSVEWGAYVRMYALLQAALVAVALLFLRALRAPDDRRALAAFVAVFWLAAFTHVGAATAWPGLALVAVAVHGRALLGRARGLALALAAAAAAPLAVSALSALVRPADRSPGEDDPFLSFAGQELLDFAHLLTPSLDAWRALLGRGALAPVLPWLVALAAAVVAAGLVAAWRRGAVGERERAAAVALALYLVPVAAIGLFAAEQHPRYLLGAQPFAFVLVAVAAAEFLRAARRPRRPAARWRVRPAPLLGAALVGLVGIGLADGLAWRLGRSRAGADYVAALAYLEERRRPEDPVIASMPPVVALALGGPGFAFLAGQEGQDRVRRYTHLDAEGVYRDYWAGAPSIVSTAGLCRALADEPGTWVVTDRTRLVREWAYAGPMAEVLEGATYQAFRDPTGSLVLRATPVLFWSGDALAHCGFARSGRAAPAAPPARPTPPDVGGACEDLPSGSRATPC